jgi:hypothetical protein
MCILCWRRTGEDDAEFIQWSCHHAERLRRHCELGTERRVRTGVGEVWVRGEGSAGWPERYSCSWDVFLVPGSLTRGTFSGHISGLGRTWQEDGDNGDVAIGWERERNDTLEQRLRQLEVVLTSMGVSHVATSAQQSLPANGDSTSSVSSAPACMINIVQTVYF